jgi:hypothetical protein
VSPGRATTPTSPPPCHPHLHAAPRPRPWLRAARSPRLRPPALPPLTLRVDNVKSVWQPEDEAYYQKVVDVIKSYGKIVALNVSARRPGPPPARQARGARAAGRAAPRRRPGSPAPPAGQPRAAPAARSRAPQNLNLAACAMPCPPLQPGRDFNNCKFVSGQVDFVNSE